PKGAKKCLYTLIISSLNHISYSLEDVWDIHFEYNTGVIDVFINALRKKLRLRKDQDYIQTIRGVGYMAKEL
ncbi:MAG: helix-turn-helix domain-containing protein, partial [Tunicatimonas sp.]